jgi:hypothetical protein
MQHNQAIFESLFSRNFSDTGNTEFLKELAERHPYFSPAQFFWLEKLQDDTAAFEKQAIKTNILFNNPHWLNFQLKETGISADITEDYDVAEHIVEEKVAPETSHTQTSAPAADLPENGIEDPVIEKTNVSGLSLSAVEIAEARFAEDTTEALPTAETPKLENTEIDDLPDNTDEPAPDSYREEKEIEPMHIELKMPEEKVNLSEAMLFEPMHMVDYFASQGIKLSEQVQTGDKLGKQLKSFTEWLKTMKKVHVENEAENPVKPDTNVQMLAEISNAQTEVLTESMAEVFARQGKLAKAIEVYQKLSLLNPAKSTYFAAKLENLKGL